MRLLDVDNDLALKNVILYLSINEAKEILDALLQLVNEHGKKEHFHINDSEYEHEVTLALYDTNNLDGFDERSKALIRHDK